MTSLAAFVALGSNLGEPAATLARAALRMDGLLPGVRLAALSRLWHSAPHEIERLRHPRPEVLRRQGPARRDVGPGCPWYANMVVRLECPPWMTAEKLFGALTRLETSLGRLRLMEARWGPRILDVDLLLFGDALRCTPRLVLPHPRMWQRPFVLLPLAEVAPELLIEKKLAGLSFSRAGTVLL